MREPHVCETYVDEDVVDDLYDSLEAGGAYPWREPHLHGEAQDTSLASWQMLLQLIEDAARDGRDEFQPAKILGAQAWAQIVRLPAEIGSLKAVQKLNLYGSSLLSIPPEIGDMESLVEFIPYTSYGLHWFPYEITRCTRLRSSTVSTRALYGNFKYRPPFPSLDQPVEAFVTANCSVCNAAIEPATAQQVWISLVVGTDVVPLLVNACSAACIDGLPKPPEGYIPHPHRGGLPLQQPPAEW